jgi:hypothetical protein
MVYPIVDKVAPVGIVSIPPEIWFGLAAICRGSVGICNGLGGVMFSPSLCSDLDLGVRLASCQGSTDWGLQRLKRGRLSAWGGTFHCAFVAFPRAIK